MVIEGPLARWATEMAERLRELGYARGSRRNHLALVAKLSGFLDRKGLSASDLSPVVLRGFCSALRRGGSSQPTAKTFAWLMEFLADAASSRRPSPTRPDQKWTS